VQNNFSFSFSFAAVHSWDDLPSDITSAKANGKLMANQINNQKLMLGFIQSVSFYVSQVQRSPPTILITNPTEFSQSCV